MIYRLLVNYFRLKLIRILLAKFKNKNNNKNNSFIGMGLLALVEFFLAYQSDKKGAGRVKPQKLKK